VLDESGNLILINQAFADLFGLSISAMLNQPLSCFISNHGLLEKITKSNAIAFNSGNTQYNDDFYLRDPRTNEIRTFALSRRVLRNGVKVLVTVASDITALKATLEALRVTQDQYARLVEESSTLILQVSNEMLITYVNGSCRKILGLDAHECIGLAWVDLIAPEDRQKFRQQWGLWSTWPTKLEARWESQIINRMGNLAAMLWSVTIIWPKGGSFRGVTVNGVDITASKKQQTELQQAKAELEATNGKLLFVQQQYVELVKTYERVVQSAIIFDESI